MGDIVDQKKCVVNFETDPRQKKHLPAGGFDSWKLITWITEGYYYKM